MQAEWGLYEVDRRSDKTVPRVLARERAAAGGAAQPAVRSPSLKGRPRPTPIAFQRSGGGRSPSEARGTSARAEVDGPVGRSYAPPTTLEAHSSQPSARSTLRSPPRSGIDVVRQPLLQHPLCEPDVAADPYARETLCPYGFIDPARPHGEQLGCFLRSQQRVKQPRIRRLRRGRVVGGRLRYGRHAVPFGSLWLGRRPSD
jgi:hypothetical protein